MRRKWPKLLSWIILVLALAIGSYTDPCVGQEEVPRAPSLVERISRAFGLARGDEASLHEAARRGRVRTVKRLLERGADVNAKDERGVTPLLEAASHGRRKVVPLLLEHGANVNLRSDIHLFETALHMAAARGHAGIAEILLDNGAEINAKDSNHGITPLYLATVAGHKRVAALLQTYGADDSIEDEWGQTPAEAAALMNQRKKRKLIAASDRPDLLDPRAIVLVTYLGATESVNVFNGTRVAFAVGDGSLIVTAAHCVNDFIEDAQEGTLVKPLLISPYYGGVFEGEIVAVDEDADVAVIRAGWNKHPALELATDEEVAEAEEIVIAAYPPPEEKGGHSRMSEAVFMEHVPVLRLNMDEGVDVLVLGGGRFVGPGWSGSPMILPDNGKVTGVFARWDFAELGETTFLHNLMGSAVNSIRSLLEKNGINPDKVTDKAPHTGPEGAEQAVGAIIGCLEAFVNDDLQKALGEAQELIRLRPDSAQARLLLAWLAVVDDMEEQAGAVVEPSFRKAVELAPDSIVARAGYGRFLRNKGRNEEAAVQLKKAIEIEPDNVFALTGLVAIMSEVDVDEAKVYARRLVKEAPDDPNSWYLLAGVLGTLTEYDDQVKAAQTAMELDEDRHYRYQRRLADALRNAGRMKEAESWYKKLLANHECARCWAAYAALLGKLGAERKEDAEKAIDKVESMNEEGLVSPAKIEELRETLQDY